MYLEIKQKLLFSNSVEKPFNKNLVKSIQMFQYFSLKFDLYYSLGKIESFKLNFYYLKEIDSLKELTDIKLKLNKIQIKLYANQH